MTHPRRSQRWMQSPLLAALCLAALPASAQVSQIALDGSLPHGRTDVLTGPGTGPDYVISEDLGWRSGANLFHSFAAFDVFTGESATFTADPTLPALSHVLARVTSGGPSSIDGTLRSQIGTADFYLLNPHGVLFGGASAVDVPGSFFVSTAHHVEFAGGGPPLDLLDNQQSPILSAEPPVAFGFLASGPRAEVVFSNPQPDSPQPVPEYAVSAGKTFSIVAGDVRVEHRLRLRAPSGRIQIAATGAANARVPLDLAVPLEDLGDSAAFGEVSIDDRIDLWAINTATVPQGTIVIRGGRFELAAGSVMRAGDATRFDALGNPTGPSIDIAVSRDVDISGAGTFIRSEAQAARPSGDVSIEADEIVVRDGAFVETQIRGNRTAGDVRFSAAGIRIERGGRVSSVSTVAGAGGDIVLTANRVAILSGGQVQAFAGSPGPGGNIEVHADSLDVVDARIGTESSASGAPGSITLDVLRLDVRGGLGAVTTLEQRTTPPAPGTLAAGSISIRSAGDRAASVTVADGALVSAETDGPQPGGGVDIHADRLEITGSGIASDASVRQSTVQTLTTGPGTGGSIGVDAESVRIGPSTPGGIPGRLTAFVPDTGSGTGGSITIVTDTLQTEGGGQISTTTEGTGASGDVTVEARSNVLLTGSVMLGGFRPSGVFSRSDGAADGGDVTITSPVIEVTDAAAISSRADDVRFGGGNSGDVKLFATDSIRIVGSVNAASVTARGSAGRAGNVTLAAPEVNGVLGSVASVELLDGGIVDVSAGLQDGGLVYVKADTLRIAGQSGTGIPSGLGAEAVSTGNAGGVRVEASGLVRVEQGGAINAIARIGSTGTAGDIEISAQQIEFRGGRGTADSFDSNIGAGSIRLAATESIRVLDGAELTVRSDSGYDAGSLSLDAPRIDVRDSALTADSGGFGGNIEISTDRLELLRATVAAFSEGSGTPSSATTPAGGNITIHGGAVVLNQSRLDANGSGNANGGLIDITASPWLPSGDSIVTASSAFGLEGIVIVNTPYGEVTGDLAALPEGFLDASSLLETPCLARGAPSGSFAVQRLGQVLPPPDAPLSKETGAVRSNAALTCGAP